MLLGTIGVLILLGEAILEPRELVLSTVDTLLRLHRALTQAAVFAAVFAAVLLTYPHVW